MQIRVRLTLQFILIAASILVVAFFYIHFQFKLNLQDEYYDSLRSKALLIAEMVAGKKTDEQEFRIEAPTEMSSPLVADYPENISIYTPDGKRLYSFNPAPNDIKQAAFDDVRIYGECRFPHGKFSALAIPYMNKAGEDYVVIAESVFDQVHLDNLTQILILVFLISVTLVAIGGWFFARQALAPMSRIMNQVDALLPTDMSHRLVTTNQHDELSRLVITFNKLLDRIQQVFGLQKMFLSNISHELKNPLNVIVSQVEVTLQNERSEEEYVATLSSVLSDVKELNDVADKLMQMARINSDGAMIRFQPLRIDEMIWQTKETLLKNHPEYTIHFEVVNLPDVEQKLFFNGNEQLLRTALINLMDNGCKFSPDKQVKASLSFSSEGAIIIEFTDNGPGIPQEELPMIFNAFYRSPRTSTIKGSGIGLSLVQSILKLHRIELNVNSRSGHGTTFILIFPVVSVEEPIKE
ncbi:MAG TPA: HAMP domain-containing sensor histidine kinase [Saprospiraceae bacterium]|mgnify:FL=1|nr:HAMP domain-containing sensor histidine kinase [Saprospiraceae bacterium]